MDYLQQATERARREREGALGKTPEPGINTLDTPRAPERDGAAPSLAGGTASSEPAGGAAAPATAELHWAPAAEAPPKGADLPPPSRVQFTRTRQVQPDDDTLAHNRVIAAAFHDARVGVYRQLRSQVLDAMHRNGWKTLAITSAHENAGKTLTALNLAIAISQEVNQTVMLVDLDLRKPGVHTTLGIEIERGIVDHLQHDVPLDSVLINPDFPRLVILPGLPQGRNASEILTSPEMKAFLGDITTRYPDRLIIFDLPPLLRNDDAMAFVPSADCCLLVVEDGVTTPDQLERSRKLLRHSHVLGTVLNKARQAPAGG
jgi:Mrp family chromosome partitioning ATPase